MEGYISRKAEALLRAWLTTPKVLMLLGARQVGKTTLLKTFFLSHAIRYLNFDVEIDKEAFLRVIPLSPEAALIALGNPDVLILDEAQRLPQASRIVKGWYDSGVRSKIILSGSSSLDILDQSAESLTGRNIKIMLSPLLFGEIIAAQPWYSPHYRLGEGDFADQVHAAVFQSMVFGSYPQAVVAADKAGYLTTLVSDYLFKDIYHMGLVKNPDLIRKLLSLLARQTGSLVSVHELAGALALARETVNRYLDLLEQTFIIFRLPAYSTNPRKEVIKNKKIFFWDTGVRNALIGELNTNANRPDIGQLWENWVVAEFAKKNALEGGMHMLYFWRSQSGSEVDLVAKDIRTGKLAAYEMKWSAGKATKAFTSRYGVPVTVIHKANAAAHLL